MASNKTLDRQEDMLSTLQGSWLRLTMLWLAAWLLTFLLLQRDWPNASRWLVLSGMVLAAILWHVRRKLPLNHLPQANNLLPQLGPANQLTLVRGLLLGLLAGFLFSPWPMGALAWFVAGLYTAASLTDAFDGVLARRSGQVTALGQLLDMELDGFGVLLVVLLAISYGQLPAWFLLVGLARYLFVFGLWWRKRQGQDSYPLPASKQRRILAGMLMGMMTVVLWPIVPGEMAYLTAVVIGVPVLAGFLRDWLFVSGRLSAENAAYRRLHEFLTRLLTTWLPPLLRLLLVASMIGVLAATEPWYRPGAWEALLQVWRMPGTRFLAALLVQTAVLGTVLVALGTIPRLAGLLLLFPIGFSIATSSLTLHNGTAQVCSLLIVLFGSGPYSLWQPEDGFLVPRGQRTAN